MQINDRRIKNDITEFKNLKVGATFIYRNRLYIKTSNDFDLKGMNAVDLVSYNTDEFCDNINRYMSYNETVQIVKCEVNIM